MKQNKEKDPMKETTKDDSSDAKKVKQPETEARSGTQASNSKSEESREAQKGHA